MKAWRVVTLGQPTEVIELQSQKIPEPGPGEVLVKVSAAGMGLPDVLMCKGEYEFSPELPFTPGQEVAGVVMVVGEGSALEVGERVMGVTSFYAGKGSFAEYCLAPDFSLYPIPEGMSDVEAAVFGIAYHTAWIGLKLRAEIQAKDVLLVHGGAGGTGSAAIQLGKALGNKVIATASSDEKLDYCRSLGADHCINYRDQDFSSVVLGLTGGRGADVVYDPVGGDVYEKSVDCTASGGRLLAVGFASGRWGEPNAHGLVLRNCSAVGVFVGAYDHETIQPCHEALAALYSANKITVPIAAEIALDQTAKYLAKIERREILGKVVIDIGGSLE